MLYVYTCNINTYSGPYKLDITVKGQHPLGKIFAPTWDMVVNYKKNKNTQKYTKQYHNLMRKSYINNYTLWQTILNKPIIVLACFCKSNEFCHRYILTKYLQACNAVYIEEIHSYTPSFKIEPYKFLSNFYISPFTLNNIHYKSVEHYYQAYKTTNITDFNYILKSTNPKTAIKNVKQKPINREQVMYTALYAKFTQNKHLLQKLIQTKGTLLIENNYWHDNFWGNCTCKKCLNKPGDNLLGKLLTNIRLQLTTAR